MVKKRYAGDSPNWYRLKKLWGKMWALKHSGDILGQQKLAPEIQACQKDLNINVHDFTSLQSIVLWE